MNLIWKTHNITVEIVNSVSVNTMANYLDIRFTEIGPDFLKATMPVNDKTRQPYGLLHGGASAVLAETVGSVASRFVIGDETHKCVGMEINCNHIRSKKEGIVTATAIPLHLGATTHIWDIKIRDEKDKLICVSRFTVAIIKKR